MKVIEVKMVSANKRGLIEADGEPLQFDSYLEAKDWAKDNIGDMKKVFKSYKIIEADHAKKLGYKI